MYSSVYASCHSKKFERRCSPDVRIRRSGSPHGAVYNLARIASSSMSSSCFVPLSTSAARLLAQEVLQGTKPLAGGLFLHVLELLRGLEQLFGKQPCRSR